MIWRARLIILFALAGAIHSRENAKKALIIAVDELKPEESDAIISDVTINDKRSSPYQKNGRSKVSDILKRSPINKDLDFILVRPEDLKALKKLEDVTIEKPQILRYPESNSDESYEASRYTPYSQPPEPHLMKDGYRGAPNSKPKSRSVKYPSRPAPPLITHSGGESSSEEPIYYDLPYLNKNHPTYDSPYGSPYKQPLSYDTPTSGVHGSSYGVSKPFTGNTYGSPKPNTYPGTPNYYRPGSSYGNSKPSTYPGHSIYGTPGYYSGFTYYDASKPSSYGNKYSHSSPSYGTSNSGSYSGPSNYESSKPSSGPTTHENSKPGSYSGPPKYESPKPSGYSGHSSYGSSKPSSYFGPSTYDSTKSSNYSGPSTYDSPNPSSYSGPSTYDSPKPSSYSGPSPYESPKPSSYSKPSTYDNPKPSSYSGPSAYGSPKPNSHSGPPIYDNSKPSSYSRPLTYDSHKPSSYSGPSAYDNPKPSSYPGPTTYDSPKPSSYSRPSTYNNQPSSYAGPSPYDSPKPSSYTGPSTYDSPKPSSYSGPSSYDSHKPSSYSGPSSYDSHKPSSYSGPSTYDSHKPSSYSGPSTYDNPKPNSYSGPPTYSKPSSYSGPHTYESSGPGTSSGSYGSSGPNAYSDTSGHSGPENAHSKSKPSSYSTTSSYFSPESDYSPKKPPAYYDLSHESPHYDSSHEKSYPNSEKYPSSPDNHHQPYEAYSYDYDPKKITSHESEHEQSPNYTPNKSYGKKYYDSPSVSIVPVTQVYKEFPDLYNSSPEKSTHDNAHTEYSDDSPKSTSKPTSYDTYYPDSLPKDNYGPPSTYDDELKHVSYHSSKPSYGEKILHAPVSPIDYKPRPIYNPNHNTEYHYSPVKSRVPYDTLKTSYQTLYGPSPYEKSTKSYLYRYPASKVTYDSSTYRNNHHPKRTPDLKDTVRSKYGDSTYSKPNVENEYHSGYDSPHSLSDDIKYGSKPYTYDDTSSNLKSSSYDDPSTFNTPSSLEYGTRYPTSYRKTRHTDSRSPVTSHFAMGDVQSPSSVADYDRKSKPGSTESHSHYHYDQDSEEIPDSHSAKKNYSPVRPAPLHDQLEQPRYPPLPKRSKGIKDKNYFSSDESQSKESSENYNSPSSHTRGHIPDSYSKHSRNPYKTESHYPTSVEAIHYYPDHSSGEEPVVYTTTYTKPYKDSSTEHISNNPNKNSHKSSMPDFSSVKTYSSEGKDFAVSQPEYSRPVYRGSQRSPAKYLHSYAYESEKKPSVNASLPMTYSSLSSILPPKRVEGVVYRSRQSYPHIKSIRRHKGYFPYKPNYPRSYSAYDYKSVPSEISEKNVTRDLPTYSSPKKTSKSKNTPPKTYTPHSSIDSKDSEGDGSDDSNHSGIPGEPGKDYPVLKEIPYNHYSCENKIPGYYADVENRCQVYYQCSEEGRLQSFLCPNGTIFNQLTSVCEWWHNVDCSKSEQYFAKNNNLYKNSNSPKTRRTVNNSYRRSNSENRDKQKFSSYDTDDKIIHSSDSVRKSSKIPKY